MSAGDWKDMFVAAENGNLELIQYHIRNGCDPNYQHPEILSTPLMASIRNDHFTITQYLLEQGADPYLRAELEGMNAFQAAKYYKRAASSQLLKKYRKSFIATLVSRF